MKFFTCIFSGASLYAFLAVSGYLEAMVPGQPYTYYQVLGLEVDTRGINRSTRKAFTDSEIKKAWKQIVKEWHPDKWQPFITYAELVIKDLDEAFETVKGAAERAKYNASSDYIKVSQDTAGAATRAHFLTVSIDLRKQLRDAYKDLVVSWDVGAWTKVVYGEKTANNRIVISEGIYDKIQASKAACPVMPSHYERLRVLPTASDTQIELAYQLRLAEEGIAEWEQYLARVQEKFYEVNEMTRHIQTAYNGLKGVDDRKKYNLNQQTLTLSIQQSKPFVTRVKPVSPPVNKPDERHPSKTQEINRPHTRYIDNKTILFATSVTIAGLSAWYWYTQYYQNIGFKGPGYSDATPQVPLIPTRRPVRSAVDHAFEKKTARAA